MCEKWCKSCFFQFPKWFFFFGAHVLILEAFCICINCWKISVVLQFRVWPAGAAAGASFSLFRLSSLASFIFFFPLKPRQSHSVFQRPLYHSLYRSLCFWTPSPVLVGAVDSHQTPTLHLLHPSLIWTRVSLSPLFIPPFIFNLPPSLAPLWSCSAEAVWCVWRLYQRAARKSSAGRNSLKYIYEEFSHILMCPQTHI